MIEVRRLLHRARQRPVLGLIVLLLLVALLALVALHPAIDAFDVAACLVVLVVAASPFVLAAARRSSQPLLRSFSQAAFPRPPTIVATAPSAERTAPLRL